MRLWLTLLRREVRGWLLAPATYVMAACFLAACGLVFWGTATASLGHPVTLSEVMFAPLFFWLLILGLAVVAAVRGMAEERDSGMWELLLTAPVPESAVVLAKYGGTLIWLWLVESLTVAYLPILRATGQGSAAVGMGALAAGYALVALVTALLSALALVAALVLHRQAAAGAVAFCAGGMLFFLGPFAETAHRAAVPDWLAKLGAAHHIVLAASGVVDSRVIIGYLSGIAVLVFAAVRILEWSRYRRGHTAWDMVAGIALALTLAGMVNYLSSRHYVRVNLAEGRWHRLSARTEQILAELHAPVQVTVLAQRSHPLTASVKALLARYGELTPQLDVEFVEPERDLARAGELARKYDLRESNVVVFECQGRHRVVTFRMLGVGERGGQRGAVPRLAREAEALLSAALFWTTQAGEPVVNFLTGHGEHNVKDADVVRGYSRIARRIEQEGMRVRTLQVAESISVSNEQSVLVVAGPVRPFAEPEVSLLRDYLGRRGRALFLLDPGVDTNLEGLLAEWQVRLGRDRVVEPAPPAPALGGGRESRPSGEVFVTQYGRHAITRKLEGMLTVFYTPRSVAPLEAPASGASPADQVDKPRVTVLASSSPKSWGEVDFEQHPPQFDRGFDTPGPLPVAVAVEKGRRTVIEVELQPSRLVVIGDSQFVSNGGLAGANADLLVAALLWLLDQERMIAVPEPGRDLFDFQMTRAQKLRAGLLIVLGLPALALGAGIAVAWLRRDRRAAPFVLGEQD